MGILVALLLVFQGIPVAPQASGTLSGVLRDSQGKPVAGVRVSAVTRQEPGQEFAGAVLASLAETDDQGRYTIEGIPPGRYYIAAGRVDRPTYYPGVQQIASARVVQVTAGSKVSGFDFVFSDDSRRMPFGFSFLTSSISSGVRIPVRVTIEGGGRVPLSSPLGTVTIQFERTDSHAKTNVPVQESQVTLEAPLTSSIIEYRVDVLNLPAAYEVKSIAQDATLLRSGSVQTNLLRPTPTVTNSPVVVTLTELPALPGGSGVRVTGLGRKDARPVYLSGQQGIVFQDGSFEFRNVLPGRHTIALVDSPGRALGVTVVVGDRDMDGVSLEDVPELPTDIRTPAEPKPAGDAQPGTVIPPVTLKGRVIDAATQEPPPSGQVYLSGRGGPSYYFGADGLFEISRLLPGTYDLEVRVFGYRTLMRQVSIGIDDVMLDFRIEK